MESESKFCIAVVSCTSHQLSCKKRERETAFFLLAEKTTAVAIAFREIGTNENFRQKTETHLKHLLSNCIKLNMRASISKGLRIISSEKFNYPED